MAAYAEPGRVLALMMMPPLDHGSSPLWPAAIAVSAVMRTVMLPFPVSG